MPRGASPKRERQYEHIVASERSRGVGSGRAKAQLYAEARNRNIKGRASMTRAQLERALAA